MSAAKPTANLIAHYRVRADAQSIEDRARKIAVEQSVEMPLAAIRDPAILSDIVGKVLSISDAGDGCFDVRIELAAITVGQDAGQLMNMLFGNTSMHQNVELRDAEIPATLRDAFGGPNHGLAGLRALANAPKRAMTCSALKPQGMSCEELAKLAHEFALGGVDFIKDDHGLANQSFSPYAERVKRCAEAVRDAARKTGRTAHYIPSLWGGYEELDRYLDLAAQEGLCTAMLAPALIGASNFVALKCKHPKFHFFAHPSFTGSARISLPLYGKLYRLFGADAVIFATYGGRFGYSESDCRALSNDLRGPWDALRASTPVPAGGLTLRRAPEILSFYGPDTILLIGGDLLLAGLKGIAPETRAFVEAVEAFDHG